MFDRAVYSVCGMCAVNCPIEVFTAQGRCRFIQGHRQAPGIRGSLCPRGAAGLAILNDDQRPQFPLVREGERGAGRWRRVGWDEALDLAAHRIEEIRQAHGARSLMLSDAGGPFSDLDQALIRGLGSPNYFDDASARNL
ncbi:MAG: molybdopterin-dependent oxidoreductase, partial [Desulfarculus sp.]|nr:molybdopterin-dependent oxidoreductase [Desulfarculus sp.]